MLAVIIELLNGRDPTDCASLGRDSSLLLWLGIMRPHGSAPCTPRPLTKEDAAAADGLDKVRSEWCIMGHLGA